MRFLELLAPARNAEIGIAAIRCGADAVYMAGPAFGARQAAGNSMEDVGKVCQEARRYGARVFMTLNTILFDDELKAAADLLRQAEEAGVDAIIAQDPAVWKLSGLPVHASTQCAIRTPDKAKMYERMGASRIVLEREMSLEQIRAVRKAVGCELEFFVHGALCVCYSGQCYLSESLTGRSANRGACVQACRSLYDLVDGNGRTLVKDRALLSLKDYNLLNRLEDLADAGICSFKIEGRLKNITYVRNVVRAYSQALDALVEKQPEKYRRASWGKVSGGFVPDLEKTFNRGYTELFLDGKRGQWSSMEAPKSMGEEIGTVEALRESHKGETVVTVRFARQGTTLSNGDGFSFCARGRSVITGFRGDVCQGRQIFCKDVPDLYPGARLFRNIDNSFEKETSANLPKRLLNVFIELKIHGRENNWALGVSARSEDGREASFEVLSDSPAASNPQRMEGMFTSQLGKVSDCYSFVLEKLGICTEDGSMPLVSASVLNGMRRDLAERLSSMPCVKVPMMGGSNPLVRDFSGPVPFGEINDGTPRTEGTLSFKANIANKVSQKIMEDMGVSCVEPAYEISHEKSAELMRTKYCIRHELGLCPVHQGGSPSGKLFLVNNGRRYSLGFDCARCEMTVKEAGS